MSDSTLLGDASDRPTSKHSNHSDVSHEQTPLLSRSDSATRYDGSEEEHDRLASPAATSLRSLQNGGGSIKSSKGGRRWPTVVAVSLLGLVVIAIILGAFFAPAAVEEYAKQALVIEPTNLSIDSFTKTGVKARVQANFKMDALRVQNKHVRNIGRFGTWIAHSVESQDSLVEVYLPEYGNVLVGTAVVPKVVVDIRNGHITPIDFITDLQPGDIEGIRQAANDWLEGRLDKIRVLGKANVALKSGIFPLGSQTVVESLVFEGHDLPAIPEYNITRLNFREVPLPTNGRRGMAADVSLSLMNSYPVKLEIPPLGFDILVPNCGPDEPQIQLADATTTAIDIEPYSDVTVDVGGIVRELPESLIQTCPHSRSSPLDAFLSDYIHGKDTTIFVRGSNAPDSGTPDWITKIISSVTVPVPFPGHTFDSLIKNFSLTDTKFSLPDPFADPDSADANPQISGNIVVIAGLPDEMNFGLNVSRVRANTNVFYKGAKLGVLDLKKWQKAQSERIEPKKGQKNTLKIQSRIKDAPLNITDDNVFTDVIQALLFGGETVILKIEALVDVEVSTVLGTLVIKDLPAEGSVPVKPISTGKGFSSLKPSVGDLKVLSTSRTSLNLEARVNFSNPTEYTAQIPYINIHILNNGSVIGDATVTNCTVGRGNNSNVLVHATWDPTTFGGENATKIGSELLSQYISGFNTTLTFQTHEESIPFRPDIGRALSKFAIEIPTPRLGGDDGVGSGPNGDHKPHFIEDATFHLFSSTATFTLISPLKYSTIYIDSIDATALYNHTEPVGTINYDLPFKVPPGKSQSPRLPVDWSLDSVGYEELKKALGGTLKLDAKGNVSIRLGQWTETVWYTGSGIGARVSF
ncbi:uncharacterized protein PAC_09516 [Phialocephala subalpina]|uniref:Pre-rRNA processing protein n=1 Tax=Phialocephala subalpina TaxID=576137 RepID=A0A1L7X3M0_9HELO|nr:uncharacterized protein PAC_09516 [Phialocephala subalpina]